jgi:U3 small nucleolar RNA-associated protein 22
MFVDPMIDVQPSEDEMSDADQSVIDDESINSEDDQEVEMDSQDIEEEEQPAAGPSKPKHRDLYAPPTLEELDTLSSSTSTSFNLQLSALLSSTLIPQTPHSSLKTLLTEIHTAINAIPDGQAVAPKDGIRAVGLPIISPPEFYPRKVNWTVGYENPSEVFVGGSWSVAGGYKRGKGEQGGVDMVITMPEVSPNTPRGIDP